MDMQQARENLKKINELRFYKKYIDQSLAGDFSQELWGFIEHLQQQSDKLTADNAALVEALEKARVKLEAATTSTNGMIKAVFTEEALLILKDCKLESKHG